MKPPYRADDHWRRRTLLALATLFAVLAVGPAHGASAADNPPDGTADTGPTEIRVSVPYVTNRQQDGDGSTPGAYGGERGMPSLGRCEVAFTPIPIINELAPQVPFHVPAETRKMRFAPQADADAFWGRVSGEIARTSSRSVVVYVHGYNYGFERNCKVAAEIQRALQGKAVVLMFSWPSNGRPSDYLPDQADVEWSVPFLAQVLAQLGDRVGRGSVQVLAHSLGTRGVIFALDQLSAERDRPPFIGPLVLMAPDFDAQTFVDRLPRLATLAGGITLYASSNDTPLKVSQQLHGSPRLGEAGEFLTVAEPMQTVDVSSLGRYQLTGHEYFLFHPRVAADLAILLGERRDASQRPGLRAVDRDGLVHWEVTEDASPASGRDE